MQALIFLKLLVSGHMTIYLTRNKGPTGSPWPSWKLVVPAEATQLLGTLVVVRSLTRRSSAQPRREPFMLSGRADPPGVTNDVGGASSQKAAGHGRRPTLIVTSNDGRQVAGLIDVMSILSPALV